MHFVGRMKRYPDLTRAAEHFVAKFRIGALGFVNLDKDAVEELIDEEAHRRKRQSRVAKQATVVNLNDLE